MKVGGWSSPEASHLVITTYDEYEKYRNFKKQTNEFIENLIISELMLIREPLNQTTPRHVQQII